MLSVATGRKVHLLRGHAGSVAAIAISPSRRWIATGEPISVGVWPMSTGRILFYLRGQGKFLTDVSFSPDGHMILSTSSDGTVRTYTCEVCGTLDSLVRIGVQRLARGG